MKTLIAALITVLSLNTLSSQENSLKANQINLQIELEDDLKLIKWETNKESNSSCFIVERKVDAKPYEIIKVVKAKGYTTSSQEYEMEDVETFPSEVTYKVSLIKMGGETASFAIEAIQLNGLQNLMAVGEVD